LVGGLRRLHLDNRSDLAPAACGLGFVVVAILVRVGSLNRLDQWSVDHLMPGLAGTSTTSLLDSLFPIFNPGKERGHVAIAALTYWAVWIASVVPSVLLVAVALLCLRSRGRQRLALRLALVFVAVNVIEVVDKGLITRPALYADQAGVRIHVGPFDSSFPSGHMTRAVVLAACVAICLPRVRTIATAWVIAVAVMLAVGGWHTPSDVAGGLLLATGGCLFAFMGSQDGGRRSDRARVEVTPLLDEAKGEQPWGNRSMT
jgi:membrane-associated phospholipid phosphatase